MRSFFVVQNPAGYRTFINLSCVSDASYGPASEAPDAIRNQTISDPHSFRKYRVNGVVRNIDRWYSSFAVKPSDKLYVPPARRVRIW